MMPVRFLLLATAGMLPLTAHAHGFGALYNLPVPLWLYNWSAATVLLLSFFIAAVVLSVPVQPKPPCSRALGQAFWARALTRLVPCLRWFAVFLLLLCVATGFFGNRDPVRNFSLTFFWIIFTLLFTYVTAMLGNFYTLLNPWQTLTSSIDRLWHTYTKGRVSYPAWLGDWPALALYLGFIWFELFGTGRPQALALFLSGYTLLNFVGVWLVGSQVWFRHCELFSVFLRLVALIAPIDIQSKPADGKRSLRLRWPFAGLLIHRPQHISNVTFALAMLSTTAFDGLKATQWWVSLFWRDPTGLITAWLGVPPVNALATARPLFIAWESLWLFTSPFIYLGAYLATIWMAKLLTRSPRSVRALALDFGFAFLPIAVVYHITHYATLIFSHGLKIISLASDPFGWRWDLFGTAFKFRAPILPDMGVVWHTQVGLILLGHIVSVWIAHIIALRAFRSRGLATLSQVPMLALMIGFTVAGLWILSQPLTAMLMR